MARRVRLVSTAYGPPWGGIQGTGVTATGVDLRKNPRQYVVAVDPRVIPLGSKLKIPDNPFGDPNIVFTAADTGGAIKGNRLDFFDWRGRKTQMNWGTRPITASIVGSGNPRQPMRAGATPAVPGAPGTAPSLLGGTSPSAYSDGSGADVASLIQALMSPSRAASSGMGLPAPSFSAHATLPGGYQVPSSGGGPAPKPDLGSVIGQIMPALQQLGQPADRDPGLLIPGQPGTPGTPGTPGARIRGAVGGSPIAGQRPHAATHQTSGLPGYPAFDYMANAGTPVVAPVTGKIVKLSGSDPRNGPSQGPHGPFGLSVYVRGNDGHTYYLTHLGSRNVRVGQTVRQGAQIGTVGNYAKYGGANHVHMGVH
jgi:3D (Asp-Asp-Asp) domain-containing protein/biotin carboxyl carrier protein